MRSNDELDAPVERVLVESGLASRGSDGHLVLAPGLADLRVQRGGAFGESIVSAMGQAVDAAKRSTAESGWDADDDTLVAQGRASAAAGRLLATTVASQLAGLSERLAQPGAEVLDVGTGVAELACALAEALPSVRVVGIDVLDRALRLADRTITEHGLVDRVRVRRQSVADIKESGTFELVWLPLIFIPPDVVRGSAHAPCVVAPGRLADCKRRAGACLRTRDRNRGVANTARVRHGAHARTSNAAPQ